MTKEERQEYYNHLEYVVKEFIKIRTIYLNNMFIMPCSSYKKNVNPRSREVLHREEQLGRTINSCQVCNFWKTTDSPRAMKLATILTVVKLINVNFLSYRTELILVVHLLKVIKFLNFYTTATTITHFIPRKKNNDNG